jgi:hypothetical protein
MQTSESFTVISGPTVTAFTAWPSPVPENGTTYLNVTVQGGSSPYSFNYSGLPGCISIDTPELSCVPTEVGNFTVVVTVTDGANREANATVELQVVHSQNGPAATNLFSLYMILFLLAIIVIVVVVVAVVVSRRRRRERARAPPQQPWQQSPYVYQPAPWQGPPP